MKLERTTRNLARLEQLKQQHEQSLREYQALSRRIGEQKDNLRKTQEDYDVKRNKLNTLRQSIEQLEQRKQRFSSAIQSAQTRIAELEQWMYSLEAEELRSRVDKLQRRCKWLSEVQGACRRDWPLLWQGEGSGDSSCEKLLRQDLTEISQNGQPYQQIPGADPRHRFQGGGAGNQALSLVSS